MEELSGCDIKRLALVLAVQAEIKGMEAANEQRASIGESRAYGEEAFFEKAEELRNISYMHDLQI
jgi:hypothetical protein